VDPIQPERVPEPDSEEAGATTPLPAEEPLDSETAQLLRLQQPFTALGSRVGRDRPGDAGAE
jgi:hypothetical protein